MVPAYTTIFMHADFDAFFASVEQVLNPALVGKPVIVGGRVTDRSVVASASYEARARGVKTAMPLMQAARICPEATFLRGHYRRYEQASQTAFALFERFSPQVQIASLDEGFLDFTECSRLYGWEQGRAVGDGVDWPAVAERIKVAVYRATGLTISIGIASNKLIAKMATTLAKPNGIAQIWPGYEARFLAPLPVETVPGIGHKTAAALLRFNVKTVGELARLPLKRLLATFGVQGQSLYNAARGIGSVAIAPPQPPQSIGRSTTFEADTDDPKVIEGMLYYLLERAANALREQRLRARCVGVQIRYADFQTVAKSVTLVQSVDQDHRLYPVVLELLNRLHTRPMRLRRVGVTLSHLSAGRSYQEELFERSSYAVEQQLYRSIDRIRRKYGFGSLIAGRALNLMNDHPRDANGFTLRTPSLTR